METTPAYVIRNATHNINMIMSWALDSGYEIVVHKDNRDYLFAGSAIGESAIEITFGETRSPRICRGPIRCEIGLDDAEDLVSGVLNGNSDFAMRDIKGSAFLIEFQRR